MSTSISKLPVNIRKYISPHRQTRETLSPLTKLGVVSKLEYNNCVINGKIVIVNDNQKNIVRYIKCYIPNGTLIWVDIETDEFVESNDDGSCYPMYKIDKNYISHSKKHGDFSLCYPDTDGVAFEHENCFVVIVPDKNLNPIETTYSLKSSVDISGTELARPKSYPLIKITNLFSNSHAIFSNSSLVFSRLVSMEVKTCKKDLMNAKGIAAKLNQMLKDIDDKFNTTVAGFLEDNLKMDKALDSNVKKLAEARRNGNEKAKEATTDKIRRLRFNLFLRKDYLKNLFNIMSVLEVFVEGIEPFVENIAMLQKQINMYYRSIGIEQEETY